MRASVVWRLQASRRGPGARIAGEIKWRGRSDERPGAGRLRRFEGGDPRRYLQSRCTKRVDSPRRDDVPSARRRIPEEVRRGQGAANRLRVQIPRQAAVGPLWANADDEDSNFRHRRSSGGAPPAAADSGAMRQPSKASVNRPVSDLRRILNWAVSRELLAATLPARWRGRRQAEFDAIGKPKSVTTPLISNEVGEAMGSFRTASATVVLKAHGVVSTKLR